MNENEFDEDALQQIREIAMPGKPSPLNRIIDVYLSSSAKSIADLGAALEAGDSDGVERCAHSLKSSSASLGAVALSAKCKQVEILAKGGHLEEIQQDMVEVVSTYDRACAYLLSARDAGS